jgi:type III secretory pathway component EscS
MKTHHNDPHPVDILFLIIIWIGNLFLLAGLIGLVVKLVRGGS